jgi:hypothetical protein
LQALKVAMPLLLTEAHVWFASWYVVHWALVSRVFAPVAAVVVGGGGAGFVAAVVELPELEPPQPASAAVAATTARELQSTVRVTPRAYGRSPPPAIVQKG